MVPGAGTNGNTKSDAAWRMLSNIMVLQGALSRRHAMEQIAVAGQGLELPDDMLKQLRLAIMEAIENIPYRGSELFLYQE